MIFNENLGRVAKSYLKKGSKVYLEGQIQTRKWTDQSGNDRYTTEIVLQKFRGELVLLDSAGGGAGRGAFSEDFGDTGGGACAASVASAAGGVRHRPRRRRSVLGAFASCLQLRQRGERACFGFGQNAGFFQRRLGSRAARIGVEAEGERIGDRRTEVDFRAVVEDDVKIVLRRARSLPLPAAASGSGMKTSSNGSSIWVGTGSSVTTQRCSSAAASRPRARTTSPSRESAACASRHDSASRPSRRAMASRSPSSAIRSSRSPSPI